MLATVIVSSYTSNNKIKLFDAIEELCSASDNYGWASSGVYAFWEIDTKRILYIGLAVNLSQRFAQHNDLLPTPAECCKRVQIADYLSTNPKLGYSIMVQSTLSQCINANSPPEVMKDLTIFAEKNGYSEEYELEELKRQVSSQGYEQITYMESLLITAYKAKYGKIPPWNKIHGKKTQLHQW